MLKFLWIILEMLLCALAGCIAFVIIASILDFFRGNKNRNAAVKQSRSSGFGDPYDAAHKRISHSNQIDCDIYVTAARMAQEAHDIAVRDSWAMHEEACHMAQQAHDTSVYDHQAAADYHDQYVAAPDFGGCNPFF